MWQNTQLKPGNEDQSGQWMRWSGKNLILLLCCFVGWFAPCNARCVIFFSLLGTGSCFLCLLQMFRKLIPWLAPVWHWPRSTLPHPAFILLNRSICSLFLIPLSFVHKTIHQPSPASPHLLGWGCCSFLCLKAALAEEWSPKFCQVKVPSIKTVFTFSLWDSIWGIYNLVAQNWCRLNL